MVDWDRVDALRRRGWDWARIAEDPKVGFRADPNAADRGRALRALAVRRRGRRPKPEARDSPGGAAPSPRRSWTLARVGFLAAPLFAGWFLLADLLPSPFGLFVAAIPTLGLFLAVAGFLLAFGLLRTTDRWNRAMRQGVAVGAVTGLVVAGGFGLAALAMGCPAFLGTTSAAPDGFRATATPGWTDAGRPVIFFLGSIACPYCSASSWAIVLALENFGTLTGVTYAASNPGDPAYPGTPEEVLAGASFSSATLALEVAEGTDDHAISAPGFANCQQQAYAATFDSGNSVPFLVIGGKFVEVGSLVNPGALRVPSGPTGTPLSPAEVQREIGNRSGPAWNAIWPASDWLTAYLLTVDHGEPAALLTNQTISADRGSIP
jgi:hypothetical protein